MGMAKWQSFRNHARSWFQNTESAGTLVLLLTNPWTFGIAIVLGIFAASLSGALTSQGPVTVTGPFLDAINTILRLPSNPIFQVGFIVFALFAFRHAVRDVMKRNEAVMVRETAARKRGTRGQRALIDHYFLAKKLEAAEATLPALKKGACRLPGKHQIFARGANPGF